MRRLLAKLWSDDAGIVTIEYLILATFLALALIVGVATLANAANIELLEVGQAILTFDQSYSVSGYSACSSYKTGSSAFDTYTSTSAFHTLPTQVNINQSPCL